MFCKLLIANRGEIACRVIKTAKQLGISTVAVYSDADVNSLHVKLADEAIRIGVAPSNESYLLIDRIIEAAQRTDAKAIHPGYGFLSENAEFANACEQNGLIFVGPPTSAIEAMGSKSAAKSIMQEANVPLVPGYHGSDQNPAILKQAADDMGYPVLLKAIAGGGGKGMRQVWVDDEFEHALKQAKSEAKASFDNDEMLVEKYLTQPRHVEVQVFCDKHGNGVYLFERDCSVQRRHQKVIEEAPAPHIDANLRKTMGETAVAAAKAINYVGAGTVEFLLDTNGSFYFMEMNTRLQVEHPVTEMITGEDLVEWQLRVADGEPLPKTQDQLSINGHAFEARVYAEDPNNDFLPTTGTLHTLLTPETGEHVRVDTGVVQGDEVSPYYDPMIAKLVVWGETRDAALLKLASALRDYRINGVTTNLNFLYDLATHSAFKCAELDTGFIEKHQADLFTAPDLEIEKYLAFTALYLALEVDQKQQNSSSPWSQNNAWRMNQPNDIQFKLSHKERNFLVVIEQQHKRPFVITVNENNENVDGEFGDQEHTSNITMHANGSLNADQLTVTLDGHKQTVTVARIDDSLTIFDANGSTIIDLIQPAINDVDNEQTDNAFIAPMNGTIVEIMVQDGDSVEAGQAVIIMEAMKMQHTVHAPTNGTVIALRCSQGDLVDGGTSLLEFAAEDSES